MDEQQNIIIYRTADGKASVALYAKDGKIWLNQQQMAELFATSKQTISHHVINILKEKELNEISVVKEYLTTAADGKNYNVVFYSLHFLLFLAKYLESYFFFVSLPSVRGEIRDKIIKTKEVMAATVLNEAQLELLRMVSVFNTPEAVTDLKQAISNYFAQKTEDEIDRLWEDGTLTEAKVESFRSLHERTAYK